MFFLISHVLRASLDVTEERIAELENSILKLLVYILINPLVLNSLKIRTHCNMNFLSDEKYISSDFVNRISSHFAKHFVRNLPLNLGKVSHRDRQSSFFSKLTPWCEPSKNPITLYFLYDEKFRMRNYFSIFWVLSRVGPLLEISSTPHHLPIFSSKRKLREAHLYIPTQTLFSLMSRTQEPQRRTNSSQRLD